MKQILIAISLLLASSVQAQQTHYRMPVVGQLTPIKIIGLTAVAGVSIGVGVVGIRVYKLYQFCTAVKRGNVKRVEAMIKKNPAFLTVRDGIGFTTLHGAVLSNQQGVVEALLKLGIDTTISCKNIGTAEDLARSKNYMDIANLLEQRRLKLAAETAVEESYVDEGL